MYTYQQENADFTRILAAHRPYAAAYLKGAAAYSAIGGRILFYPAGDRGILVVSNVRGLPVDADPCSANIFAMHIHENGVCQGDAQDPFAQTGAHYNPDDCPHPAHAGDLPPLFANAYGKAWGAVLTDRISLTQLPGKSVVLHRQRDDFSTQSAGNAGEKIACGTIVKSFLHS